MPDELWRALRTQAVAAGARDARLDEPRFADGYECGIVWEFVMRAMHARARRDAARAGEVLHYAQAVDKAAKQKKRGGGGPVHPLTARQHRGLAGWANMSENGKRMPFLPLFVGMRVRLTEIVSRKDGLVQEQEGTVVGIARDDADDAPEQRDGGLRYVVCRRLPTAVYVEVDKAEPDGTPVPPLPEALQAVVAGVRQSHTIAIGPTDSRAFAWAVDSKYAKRGESRCYVARRQLALTLARVRTCQSSQGYTFRGGAVLDLSKPRGEHTADYWLNVHTMMGRPRALADSLYLGLPERSFFEGGPPADIVRVLARLATRSAPLHRAAEARLRELGCAGLVEW